MEFEPIPGPRGLPIVGNFLDLRDEEATLHAFNRMADTYGPIYQLTIGGQRIVVICSADLMKEFLDEKRFFKTAIPGLGSDGKDGRADGLIVAGTADPDWAQAHRILRPVSSQSMLKAV
jgi:cytochrome P450 / NADPH-cytochrome P450 reductase